MGGDRPLVGTALRDAWLRLHADGRRAHEAAAALGVTEAELVASTCTDAPGALHATPLDVGDGAAFLSSLAALGVVKTQTRSECVVLEVVGAYPEGRVEARPEAWGALFAVRENAARVQRTSLQLFDVSGAAVQKIFLLGESDEAAFERLVLARRLMDLTVPRAEAMPAAAPVATEAGDSWPLRRLLRTLATARATITVLVDNRGVRHTRDITLRRMTAKNDWLALVDRDAKILIHRATRAHARGGDAPSVTLSGEAGPGALLTRLPESALSPLDR